MGLKGFQGSEGLKGIKGLTGFQRAYKVKGLPFLRTPGG